jgi:hypothetical protein
MAPSITSWTRLEPDPGGADPHGALSARVLDPLWLLTRQWQIGEYQGEDTGTPVQARARARATMLTRCHLGELAPNSQIHAPAYDPAAAPLEVMVERRAARAAGPTDLRALRFTVDAGQHFLRMLADQPLSRDYADRFRARFALQPLPADALAELDPGTARFLMVSAGRAIDGRRLEIACGDPATLVGDTALGIEPGDRAELRDLARDWLTWYRGLFAAPTDDAWIPDRLEYQVSVAARLSADPADEKTLTATAFRGGRLDWSSFDLDLEVRTGTDGDHATTDVVETTVPAPVTFPGAPAQRFWEFEDARIDYDRLAIGPTDLAHLMLTEYASGYGNDWFVVPLTLPIGSLTTVDSLVVTDSFGVASLLRPIGDRALPAANWSMWQLAYLQRPGSDATGGQEPNLLFLPPSLGQVTDGPVVEEVLFMRDEMANIAWAIERTLESPVELGAPGFGSNPPPSGQSPVAPVSAADGDSAPDRYLLSTAVPDYWVPLLPVEVTLPSGAVINRLRRGAVLRPDGSQEIQHAHAEVLTLQQDLALFDEEIPREGARVTRQRRLARWIDGSTWLWAAQRNQVGRGEGSSGLMFDTLHPPGD